MAERRLFSKKITESDAFLDMPTSTQALYFHLNMNADDDGFVNAPNKIVRIVGASNDDLKLLIAKSFVIPFESGVVVIKHWLMHNLIRKDRYKETEYIDEKSQLYLKENGAYTLDETQGTPLSATKWQPSGNQVATQDKISKVKLSEDKLSEVNTKENINVKEDCRNDAVSPSDKKPAKHKYGKYNNILLTDDEHIKLLELDKGNEAIEWLSEYREMKGYKAQSDYLAIRKWVFTAMKEEEQKRKAVEKKQSNGKGETYDEFMEWAKSEMNGNET